MNEEKYKQQLIEIIMEKITEKEQELQHRKRRLEENILARVRNKSILAQRKDILDHICSKCQGEDNVIPDIQIE